MHARTRTIALLASVIGLAAPVGTAHAAFVGYDFGNELAYDGGSGEANSVVVTRSGDTVTFTEKSGSLSAGEGCRAGAAAGTAICGLPPGAETLTVRGRDGNDVVDARQAGVALIVDGGDGDDAIAGGARDDTLSGGRGNDAVGGGGGDDRLSDAEAGASVDAFDGGVGTDTLTYEGRRSGVTVDLGNQRAGGSGETDRVLAIENLEGGDGADRLVGDGGPNHIDGGAGADRVEGRGGDDVLNGDLGDRLSGGAGDDRLDPTSRVTCGAGEDRVSTGLGVAVIIGDRACEWYGPLRDVLVSPLPLRNTEVTFRYKGTAGRLNRKLRLRGLDNTLLGSATVGRAAGGTVTFSLTSAGRARLARGRTTATVDLGDRRADAPRFRTRVG